MSFFCERLRAQLLKPYENEKGEAWDACKMIRRQPGLESVLTKSSLKIPCHASLKHSCLCMLILKMYCPKEKLFLMGSEQQSLTGQLLNYITILDFH